MYTCIHLFITFCMASSDASGFVQEVATPRDEHGNVDWDALGRISVEHILNEVKNVEVAEHRHQNRETDTTGAEDGWRYAYEKHNIVIYSKKFKDSPIKCFLGRGVVDAPLRKVGEFTADIQSTYTWDKALTGARCVKVIMKSANCTDYIGYQHYETTKCLIKTTRDNLYFVRCIYTDGKYVQSAMSVEHPDCPTLPGIKRIKVYAGSGWVMEPYHGSDKKTLVTYLAHLDLINVPAIIANSVIGRHPLAIHYLRFHLESRSVHTVLGSTKILNHSDTDLGIKQQSFDESRKLQSFEESSACSEFTGAEYVNPVDRNQ